VSTEYDEFDEFDEFDFADNFAIKRINQEQKREEIRLAKRRSSRGSRGRNRFDDYYEDHLDKKYIGSIDSDYDDYNEDEFDSFS
jgi:hypothetical protein